MIGGIIMDKSPKRRKDKYNPYTLETVDNKFFVSFTDSNKTKPEDRGVTRSI